MSWNTTPLSLLNTYRVSHNLSTPAAFTSPLNQALLVNPGIGRQSPTMARRKDKRRVSKEQLATNVRKHFNGAAVNEIDVVVELVYKSRNKGRGRLAANLRTAGVSLTIMQTRLSACARRLASPRSHDPAAPINTKQPTHHFRVTASSTATTHFSAHYFAHDIDDRPFVCIPYSIATEHTDDFRRISYVWVGAWIFLSLQD
jgi:hypothetical protein